MTDYKIEFKFKLQVDSLKKLNNILSAELIQTQKKLVAHSVKLTPKFQPSLNHAQVSNDEEDGYLRYTSQPMVIKVSLDGFETSQYRY